MVSEAMKRSKARAKAANKKVALRGGNVEKISTVSRPKVTQTQHDPNSKHNFAGKHKKVTI